MMIKLNKYRMSFLQGLQNSLQYRVDFFLGLLGLFLPLFIQYYLWRAIYSGTTEQSLYGYSYAEMISYLILAALAHKIISTGFENSIVEDIKNGGLNKYLIQPVNYLLYRVLLFLGGRLYQMIVFFIIFLAFITGMAFNFGFKFHHLGIFFVALLLALVLNYLIFLCISLFAFWMAETMGLFALASVLISIMSGGVIPLDLFSGTVQKILLALPFQYTIFFPVHVLLDRIEPGLVVIGFIKQLGWIAIFAAVVSIVWRVGLRKHIAVGG